MITMAFIWTLILLVHALFYILFPGLTASGNYFMFFSALGWCVFSFIAVPLYKFIEMFAKYLGFLAKIFFFCLLIGFLALMMPQKDGVSPFEKVMKDDFPTTSDMKKGFKELKGAVFGLKENTEEAVEKGQEAVEKGKETIKKTEKAAEKGKEAIEKTKEAAQDLKDALD